ncbi:unnamed protein product [Closterium sp. NIES-65]|nr:unnamed protein product [Closterium sp. NIES-65]
MRMRSLGVQLKETRRRLEEAERRRVVETRKSRGQVKERERELAAVKGEVTELKDALNKLDVELKISQNEGDEKTAWELRGIVLPGRQGMMPRLGLREEVKQKEMGLCLPE